jgi:hypothetical protein
VTLVVPKRFSRHTTAPFQSGERACPAFAIDLSLRPVVLGHVHADLDERVVGLVVGLEAVGLR